jgi:hypothetical protein
MSAPQAPKVQRISAHWASKSAKSGHAVCIVTVYGNTYSLQRPHPQRGHKPPRLRCGLSLPPSLARLLCVVFREYTLST